MITADHMLRVTAVAWKRTEDELVEAIDGGKGSPEVVEAATKRHVACCKAFDLWIGIAGPPTSGDAS